MEILLLLLLLLGSRKYAVQRISGYRCLRAADVESDDLDFPLHVLNAAASIYTYTLPV